MIGRRLLASAALTVGLLALLPATPASAHPLGNFTVNQHAGLRLSPDRVTVQLVVDMAEIPAFQTRSEIDADRDKAVSPEEAELVVGLVDVARQLVARSARAVPCPCGSRARAPRRASRSAG